MYFKLAMQNVKKSFKDYMIYFLTLAFSICLFYSFNSFQAQQAVMDLSKGQADIIDSVMMIMQILSVFVAVVLGFLVIYANNFLIKRRKKELGLYTLLGMPKSRISRILVYETFIVGLLSLAVGLLSGFFVSQLLTVITANLFEVNLHYAFIFSFDAMLLTVIAFALIFLVIMIFNTLILNRYKLIDLIHADQKHEMLKIKNIYISIILFVLSVLILGYTYHYALTQGINALNHLEIIAPLGILGTILFFMSLAGFLLRFVQSSKSLYYRKLNMFVLRQINASVNSNFLSMSIVCIMLLFSIGALATGSNLNRTINNTLLNATPYDYTLTSVINDETQLADFSNMTKLLQLNPEDIKSESFVHEYQSDIKLKTYQKQIEALLGEANESFYEQSLEVISLSEFNELRRQYELEPIALSDEECYVFTSVEMLKELIDEIITQEQELKLYGKLLKIQNTDYEMINLGTSANTGTAALAVVVNDDAIPKDTPLNSVYWNVTLSERADSSNFKDYMDEKITAFNDTAYANQQPLLNSYSSVTAEYVKENSKGLSVIMTYIGLYLGLIFLMASAVILALQQLSQASDNKQRYLILNKLGAEKRMVNQSIFFQLSIYFFMPLLLAIVHSIVGIQVVNSIVVAFGRSDLFMASLITGGIILLIYGAYFLITYAGYKNILAKK
ncbi:ABC transporter permease [bacterium c-19]|nr:ABC transporter permease [bacterium c-19]